jgi:hypothetical protein
MASTEEKRDFQGLLDVYYEVEQLVWTTIDPKRSPLYPF